jgi:allantoate deiminase
MVSAARILERIDALAACSERPDALTRVFLSDQQRAASALVGDWMRGAGMQVCIDAIGNVVGRLEGRTPGLPCLMLGSHLDTVRDAGRYDGMLGVVAGIECAQAVGPGRLPFALEVIGFADEEGVRFAATMLGSRAVAGTFDARSLELTDGDGTTMREALRAYGLDPDALERARRRRSDVLAYAEFHIEQGPVLEAEGLPVGTVSAINGQTRYAVELRGVAGHAGTVPMALRRDALAGAAACVLAAERLARGVADAVATAGEITVRPGAVNVIPGAARFSLDLRAPRDADRERLAAAILGRIEAIAARRGLTVSIRQTHALPATLCAPWLTEQLDAAIAARGLPVRRLPSGAGHDAMAMSALTDVAMLFLRCRGGISHHPDESVTEDDVQTGTEVLLRFVERFTPRPA